VSSTAYTDTGLTPDTEYTYTVRARDTGGQTGPLSPATRIRTATDGGTDRPPSAPGTPGADDIGETSIKLSWTAATDDRGVKNYDVFRGSVLAATVTGTSATVTGLTADTDYTFTVRARDTADQVGPPSGALTVRTGGGSTPSTYAKVGYFTQWGIYGRQYPVKKLDTVGAAAKLTHLNYVFSNINPTDLRRAAVALGSALPAARVPGVTPQDAGQRAPVVFVPQGAPSRSSSSPRTRARRWRMRGSFRTARSDMALASWPPAMRALPGSSRAAICAVIS
jgi:chitodextrinase